MYYTLIKDIDDSFSPFRIKQKPHVLKHKRAKNKTNKQKNKQKQNQTNAKKQKQKSKQKTRQNKTQWQAFTWELERVALLRALRRYST